MITYSENMLQKLKTLLNEGGYAVKSGKGNFNTGHCLLSSKRVVVINKFHSTEASVTALIELIEHLTFSETNLSDASRQVLLDVKNHLVKNKTRLF
ncbi:MAG: hypothetical protein IT272_02375 [Chitinophagales bacterium]|jgi:hypothetical protein|nr:hypothetical protein [Sphingobacteriales bacterium]MBL0246447.1 hypothetical protein [Sphingobacteriales bacterium]MBP9142113.1 hypothetical protein [Chitinophagales bacterium]MCC7056240.1 hypothetical protein [Chitinophagales bacterium]HMS51102.1 hypothetical protein [Chitinophagales bacterium]